MNKLKGEVLFKGKVVPVEIELNFNWLGVMGLKVNLPKSLVHNNDITHIVDFNFELNEEVRDISEEDKIKYIK